MHHYKIKTNGVEYEVHIRKVEGNIAQMTVNDVDFEVETEGIIVNPTRMTHPPEKVIPAEQASILPETSPSSKEFRSPLPGAIIEVCVKEGDEIKSGQVLLVLESMKMENNIQAERNGLVEKINCAKGDAVLEGDLLLVY